MINEVMLIDDSEPDLLYARIMLERSGQVGTVLSFDSAHQALAFLHRPEAGTVDLILLDINMPGMDGFAFLDAYADGMGKHGCRAAIVMLSSSPDPADRQRAARNAWVAGYLTKPIDVAAARALEGYLRRGGNPA